MHTARAVIAAAFLANTAIADSMAEETKSVSIDMFLEREKIGAVFIDETRNRAYVERLRPSVSITSQLPYAVVFPVFDSRKEIVSVSLDGTSDLQPLFEQDTVSGYAFANSVPRSPDGRHWSLTRLTDGVLTPGIYDAKRNCARFFDVHLEYGYIAPVVFWISDDELLLLVATDDLLETETADRMFVRGPRLHADARERAWRDREVTSSMIGSGAFAGDPPPLRGSRIVRLNIHTGRVTVLSSGAFTRILPSSNGGNIAVYETEWFQPAELKAYGLGGDSMYRMHKRNIAVLDTETGQKHVIPETISDDIAFLSWSGTSEKLLVQRAPRSDPGTDYTEVSKAKTEYFVFDAVIGEVVWQIPKGAEQPYWVGDSVIYRIASETEGPGDWKALLLDGREVELTAALKADSIVPIGATDETVYFFADGNIWRVTIGSDGKNVTEGLPSQLAHKKVRIDRPFGPDYKTPSFARGLAGRLPDPSLVLFTVEQGTGYRFVKVHNRDGSLITVSSPDRVGEVVKTTQNGAVFLNNSTERGSELTYVDQSRPHLPLSLLRFNEHMVGVEASAGPVRIDHEGENGEPLVSWLYLPPGADVADPVPYSLVVLPYAGQVYGGEPPHISGIAASIWDVLLESPYPASMEVLAAKGYAVLFPSIPLEEFGEPDEPITRITPPVLKAVDASIAQGHVDPERIAVAGHSYGGYSALSIATQTDRFDAIIASASIANLTDHYGQFREVRKHDADRTRFSGLSSHWMFETGQNRMAAAPWEDVERYARNSPLFYADKIKTPIMLIHGDLDFVSMDQAEQVFTALARQNKDVVFVRYWGEYHSISQPQNQRDMWIRIFDFLRASGVTPGARAVNQGFITHP